MARPGHSRRSHPLLVPLALTVTAVAATAGLWFLSERAPDSSSPFDYDHYPSDYGSSSSDDEAPDSGRGRKPLPSHRKTRMGDLRERGRGSRVRDGSVRDGREHDRITEEDTEDLEEERRREESLKRARAGAGDRARGEMLMSGALSAPDEIAQIETRKREGDETIIFGGAAAPHSEKTEGTAKAEERVGEKKGQYQPIPPRKRRVAIVLSERRALTGHDSDSDFEEAGLPSSLLQHLPHPLDLSHTDLFILIHSPHLPSHPLSDPTHALFSHPDPSHHDPTQPPHSPPSDTFQHSTYDLATSLLTSFPLPLEHILPFTSASSMVPMLRQLQPELVYVEESLVEENDGRAVGELLQGGWVRDVVVVVGLGGGVEALLSDDAREEFAGAKGGRAAKGKGRAKWWDRPDEGVRALFGRRCEVVEAWVLGEDWCRRVEER